MKSVKQSVPLLLCVSEVITDSDITRLGKRRWYRERGAQVTLVVSIFRSCVRASFVKCVDGTSFLCSAI